LIGILNILKPPGMTSQNVVSYVKRVLNVSKAGHTGTLDPGAAGVLPVCIGKATKVSEYLLNDKKSYRGELALGFTSDTLDKYGKVQHTGHSKFDPDAIVKAFEKFKGKIQQVPPMFSALRQDGKRLYEIARQGKVVERKVREAHIYELKILCIKENKVLFDVTCSKGTYIRTLCSDIGKSLGSDAIMTFLLRTKTGPFEIKDAVTLDELAECARNNTPFDLLYPTHYALNEYSRVFVNEEVGRKVANGQALKLGDVIDYENREYDNFILIFDVSGKFIAVGKRLEKGEVIKVDKVFA